MKHLPLWVLALLTTVLARGDPFEGKVVLQRTGAPGLRQDLLVCAFKGDMIRVDSVREQVVSFITDRAKRETCAILEDDRAYVVVPSIAAMFEEPPPDTPQLGKSDETRRLLGYPVQKYMATSGEDSVELWLAEGFGPYTGFGEGTERPRVHVPGEDVPEPPPPMPWEQALAGQPLFPLLVIVRDGRGRETYRIEVREITPQSVPDALFSPPINYRPLAKWPDKRVEV